MDSCAQHYIECTTCNRNAEYFCNTCSTNLCQKCRKIHMLRHKNHVITIYMEKRPKKFMEFCHIHPNQEYESCCQKCEVPVCKRCIEEKHKYHLLADKDLILERKKEEYIHLLSTVNDQLLPESMLLLENVHANKTTCIDEIAKIRTSMTLKAQKLKDNIDRVLAENTAYLRDIENSLISEIQWQEKIMSDHIIYLQKMVDQYVKWISNNKRASFTLFQKDKPVANIEPTPSITRINCPSFKESQVKKEDIVNLFGKIIESKKPSITRKVNIKQAAVKTKDTPLRPTPTVIKMTSLAIPGVNNSRHISSITSNLVWVSDDLGNLVLGSNEGEKLKAIEYPELRYGCHSTYTRGTRELLFLNKNQNAIHKITTNQRTSEFVFNVPGPKVCSIYSSPSNGDILVATGLGNVAKVIRYNENGHEIHQIQYDSKGHALYQFPRYITENHHNGDVCVSDCDKHAVVVVDKDKRFRFLYKGHPPRSELLPWGICTDTQGKILVADARSNTIQMIDKNGCFLSFLLSNEHGITKPGGLCLDVINNILWVGHWNCNTVSVYRYNKK